MRSALRRAAALLAPALVLAAPAAAHAQLPSLASAGPRAGILAGLSSATFGGDDTQLESGSGVDKKRRNGVVAGAYLTFPLVPGLPVAIRPELLYAQKGVRLTGTYDVQDVANLPPALVTATSTAKLDYLELPVLLQLTVPNTAGLRPSLYAGPSVAYRLRCRLQTEFSGTSTSSGCDDSGLDRKFDASGVFGGQLGFGLGGQAIAVGARYTLGLTKLAKDSDVKNRAFAVYGAIEFGR